MPVTVEIDGLGKVELDDNFAQMSSAEQEQVISDIVAQSRPSRPQGGGGPSRDRNSPETYQVLQRLVKQLYPHADFTSDKRTPEHNRKVGGAEDSYHVSGHGLDIVGLSAAERAELKSQLEGMGIKFDEYLYHDAGSGLHLHMGTTHVPEELFEAPAPEQPEAAASEPEGAAVPKPGQPAQDKAQPEDEPNSFFRMPGSFDEFTKGLEYGTGAMVEGVGDTIGIVTNPLATVLGRSLGYDNYTADLGGTMRDGLGLDRPAEGDTGNRIAGDIVSGATGGAAFAGGAAGLGKIATSPIVARALAELGATPVRDAVAGGTAALAADATEAAGGGAVAQTVAALAGGAAGYGASGLTKAVTPDARDARFAAKQAKDNPYAAWDAEIAEDLAKAYDTLNRSRTDPKARAPLDVKVINDVQDSYTDQTIELIKQLQLPKDEELKFRNALSRKHSLPQDEIDALRGTTTGDAVADAVIKTQRIKRLTPEIAREPGMASKIAQGGALALDVAPLMGLPGTYGAGSVLTRSLLKRMGRTGDAEAARVHAAKRLLDKRQGYAKLREMVGPSGQRESRQALWDAAGQAVGESSAAAAADEALSKAAKVAKAKEQAWAAKQKMEGTKPVAPSTAYRQTDTAWNQQAKAAAASEKLKAQQEDALWATHEAATGPTPATSWKPEARQWEDQLKVIADRKAALAKATAPEKPAKAPKVNLGDKLIEDGIAQGLPGGTKTRQAFKDRIGIQDDAQFDQVLDDFVSAHPEAKAEVDRIRLSYPTKDRTFGAKATPHLKSAMEKLGIKPQAAAPSPKPASVPVDEAAQSRLAATVVDEAPIDFEAAKRADEAAGWMYNGDGTWTNKNTGEKLEGLDEATVVSGPPPEAEHYKQIRRPQQYAESKDRRVGMASDAIYDMATKVRPEIMERLKRLPEHARDNIKIGDDARKFFDEDVYNEMMAAGATPQEIDAARTTFYDIATVKPYQTQDEFNAGALTRGRGRPRKQN